VPATDLRELRFGLVNAGHEFLIRVIPFRKPESQWALEAFVTYAFRSHIPRPDMEVVLIQCLHALDRDNRFAPPLVNRFFDLAQFHASDDTVSRFQRCVEDVLRFSAVGDVTVRKSIAIINDRFGDSSLTPERIATSTGLRPAQLAVAFKRDTGLTPTQYLRKVRLERAARLLVESDKTIKEVWSSVGYNHPSNFDHDFKWRFGITPRAYRSNVIPACVPVNHPSGTAAGLLTESARHSSASRTSVMIVDDNDSTRETLAHYLSDKLYAITTAATGSACIRELERVVPAVILLDYRLPDINGLDCLEVLRQRGGWSSTAVAILTADFDVYDHQPRVHALGGIIVSKLCTVEDVRKLIDYLASLNVHGPELT
jgi:YesN/AraC family two-component response regulator